MTDDLTPYKSRLLEYLRARGVQITRTDQDRISCLSPQHPGQDEHPSMIVYETNLYCPVCAAKMDIFEAAGVLASVSDFPSKKKEVFRVLNIQEAHDETRATNHSGKSKRAKSRNEIDDVRGGSDGNTDNNNSKNRANVSNYMALSIESARAVYTPAKLLDLAERSLRWRPSDVKKEFVFKSLSAAGLVDILEVRFEGHPDGKKKYLTYWYDGKSVRTSSPPILLYNRDKLAASPDMPVLIHEGPKCVFAAEVIPGFIHTGWNSGGKKFSLCDFSLLEGRDVYVYPDDDDPGRETASKLRDILNVLCASIRIIEPLNEARALRPVGADIVEALQVRTPEELADYIKNGPVLGNGEDNKPEAKIPRMEVPTATSTKGTRQPDNRTEGEPQALPFRILGVEERLAYFLDQFGRVQAWDLKGLNQDCLRILAPFGFWYLQYGSDNGKMGKPQWDRAVEELTQSCGPVDFDLESLRGRGAWKNICPSGGVEYVYWDGAKLYRREEDDGSNNRGSLYSDIRKTTENDEPVKMGETSSPQTNKGTTPSDPTHTYIRRLPRPVGIGAPEASPELRTRMLAATNLLSFETKADAVRTLGWAVLAPYGGALPWRPAAFLTGDSGSGKTTVLNYIIKPLARLETQHDICTGSESSGAGVRQHDPFDSLSIGIEESDTDNKDKKHNVEEIISIMRVSASDDTAPAWKGTQDQKGMKFSLRRMFIFLAIDNSIGEAADLKRFFFINVARPDDTPTQWKAKRDEIKACFTPAACAEVRSFTWNHLAEIIDYAETMSELVHEIANHPTRYAYLEAMLFSAWWRVFMDRFPDEAEAREWLAKVYAVAEIEHIEDKPVEVLNRIFAEVVQVEGDYKEHESLGVLCRYVMSHCDDEGLSIGPDKIARYIKTLGFWGIWINKNGVNVANKNPKLAAILQNNISYHKILQKHPYVANKHITIGKWNIAGVLLKKEVIVTEEIPF